MLYQTRDHSPSAINHVEHDLPISRAYRERGHATVNYSRRIAKYLLLLKLEVTPINY